MSGVSVGWFDLHGLHPDPQALTNAIIGLLGPRLRRTRAWPFATSSIRFEGKGVGVAYALVAGHVPLHLDSEGLPDSDGRVFQFVLAVENRPAVLVAPFHEHNEDLFRGYAPPTKVATFGLGGLELKVGQAVWFDITENWHGISALPVGFDRLDETILPSAVIVQVSGFAQEEMGAALSHAAHWIAADAAAAAQIMAARQ